MVSNSVRIDVILYKVTKYLSNYKILDYNIFFINISHLVSSSVLWYFLANGMPKVMSCQSYFSQIACLV